MGGGFQGTCTRTRLPLAGSQWPSPIGFGPVQLQDADANLGRLSEEEGYRPDNLREGIEPPKEPNRTFNRWPDHLGVRSAVVDGAMANQE